MAEVLFYHLTRRTLESVVPGLLEKCLERNWKVLLRAGSPERAAALNRHLWTYQEDGFLPHGGPDDGEAARQPIYLTAGPEAPNAPDVVMLVDGAAADPAELAGYVRALLLFDGHDEEALGAARNAWRAVTAAGMKAVYWAETDAGGWTKKAESA
ncbi:DNA polymerase III subunit chi [Pikeienuella sp. HZG-20]|uniref:DNA polymerase III subunit chi n=1 Tax=Paludibacillus litoralis TaxID=3133267 RepID=UPI0030EE9C58